MVDDFTENSIIELKMRKRKKQEFLNVLHNFYKE